ncbi:hypothetical protein [Peribacillus sp. NPDC097895]|uniref:hypothetical protein n=1 Tax=Peribacillus sp. NPDC097895 TaxID=3390619 RepID=UPI003D03D68F
MDFRKEMFIQQLRFDEKMLELTLKQNHNERMIASMRKEVNKTNEPACWLLFKFKK